MAEQMEELLTVQEVASILRVDQTTVRRWIKNGCALVPFANSKLWAIRSRCTLQRQRRKVLS